MALPVPQLLHAFSVPAGPPERIADPEEGGGSFQLKFRVAGFQYHQGHRVLDILRPGDCVELFRDPGNPFDSNAIRIFWYDIDLGYVPMRVNPGPAALLDGGAPVLARIAKVDPEGHPWEAVQVRMSLPFQDLPSFLLVQ